MFDNKTRLPLYVQTKEYIAALMDTDDFPPGTKLPTENELMEKLQVGRATVRTALAELEREGRVLKRHGIGTFVCEKEVSYSFEPLVSLSYSLKQLGFEIKNEILASEMVKPTGELLKGWEKNMNIGHLKRLRLAQGKAVAVEDSYFIPSLFEVVTKLNPSQSVAHAILSYPDINIDKVELAVLIRVPEKEEKAFLALPEGKKVAEMTRWIYRAGNTQPVNFVRFVMPEDLMGSSFWSKNDL
ncbi:MAG TPA: GntR family transcriptional regulator [Clostridia bacterium]|nr:GntR family transcriptional regulator [Clostridia bacterium]